MKALHKKGTFRILKTSVWNMFRKTTATPADRFVYICLEAGPHAHYTGLFQVHLVDIAEFTGMSEKEVRQALDRLSGWKLIVYDPSRQMVFVRGMLQRQLGTSTPHENNVAGIVYYVERMAEDSPAVLAFMEENRDIPEFEAILDDLYPPPPPGTTTGEDHPPGGPTRDLRLETSDVRRETRNDLQESVNAVESPASTSRVQPSSSSPPSSPDPKVNGSPLGSSSTPTPGKAKAKATATAKASGKGKPGNGNGLSTSQMKKKGLAIVAKRYQAKEWDIFKVSNVLTTEYGFTKEDINSREVMDALGLFQDETKEAN